MVRHGYMVYTWGDHKRRGDVASACKPWFSHFLFKAVEDGKIKSVDEKVIKWEPRLKDINAKLGHKDRGITWRHFANQTSCYQLAEKPGTAYAYNDWQMALFRAAWSSRRAISAGSDCSISAAAGGKTSSSLAPGTRRWR